ncbi:MAG: nucleoside-diphosphate sugar epimerase/dehydratase [Candidatus Colwellbacteria bacterium]|nr:nucleoside-diphosphate sugar epimerase/dehydratase [Candidatus Colwellbacteria bacterium]
MRKKILIFTVADAILSALALIAAFLLRFEATVPPEYYDRLLYYILIFVALNLVFLRAERLYSFTWSFVSLTELTRLFRALTYTAVTFALLVFIGQGTFNLFSGFPRSIVPLSYILSFVLIGGLRISKRIWFQITPEKTASTGEPILIVGAGKPGEHLIRSLQAGTNDNYRIVGLVDERPANQGISIHGLPVRGYIKDIPGIVNAEDIKQVIIALERHETDAIQNAVNIAREAGVANIKIIPEFSELLGQTLSFRNLKEISIEDLLGRESTNIETEKINEFIRNRTVLVTGAAGSIGSELSRQILQFSPSKLIILDIDESGIFNLEHELKRLRPRANLKAVIASVTDRVKIAAVIGKHKPEIIFHAAAYKHVPLMENHPEEAIKVNVLGTLNTARAAAEYGVKKFVLVSTDKAVRPVSVMGKTKRIAEMVVKSLNNETETNFVAVRFGNVLGSRGSVIPLFQEQIRRGGPVTVTHPDMVRYFMTTPEASLLVMEAGAIGQGGEIFILDMGKPVKIIDLARELIRLSGYTPDVHIPITITGIRPGENLFEDILTEEEKQSGATKWEKIYVSRTENNLQLSEIINHLSELEEKLFTAPEEELRNFLDRLIAR